MICILGLLSCMAGMVSLGLSSSVTMVFISALLGSGTRLADSLLRSLISQNVDQDEIGKVFGVVAVLGDLALIIGKDFMFSLLGPLCHPVSHPSLLFNFMQILNLLPYHRHSYDKIILKSSAAVSFHHKKMNNIDLHNHNIFIYL